MTENVSEAVDFPNPFRGDKASPRMKQNAANWDRVLRAMAGLAMLGGAFLAPLPLLARVLALGGGGAYMLGSALVGTCLGYRLIGISTCPIAKKGNAA